MLRPPARFHAISRAAANPPSHATNRSIPMSQIVGTNRLPPGVLNFAGWICRPGQRAMPPGGLPNGSQNRLGINQACPPHIARLPTLANADMRRFGLGCDVVVVASITVVSDDIQAAWHQFLVAKRLWRASARVHEPRDSSIIPDCRKVICARFHSVLCQPPDSVALAIGDPAGRPGATLIRQRQVEKPCARSSTAIFSARQISVSGSG